MNWRSVPAFQQPTTTEAATQGSVGVAKSLDAPTLPAASLSFADPLSASVGDDSLRWPARPVRQTAFYQYFVNVSFDGAKFNTQRARYFLV